LPPVAVEIPLKLVLSVAFLVSSKPRLEVAAPPTPPVAALLPPLPAFAYCMR
jgi:hypothetical protein